MSQSEIKLVYIIYMIVFCNVSYFECNKKQEIDPDMTSLDFDSYRETTNL